MAIHHCYHDYPLPQYLRVHRRAEILIRSRRFPGYWYAVYQHRRSLEAQRAVERVHRKQQAQLEQGKPQQHSLWGAA